MTRKESIEILKVLEERCIDKMDNHQDNNKEYVGDRKIKPDWI